MLMLPEALKEDAEKTSAPNENSSVSLPGVLIVLAALALFFYKSVFLAKPIGKLGLLPLIDGMFNPELKKAIISFADPSGYLIFFPNGFFAESMWAKLVPPLWNPLVACGYPLFGDPQSLIHSLGHLLGLFSSPEAYNCGLLLEIAAGGIGMYCLGRYMKLSVPASIFVALAYELSPRVLVQVDISGNESFFPWAFLSFAWLAKSPSMLRAALVGVVSAVLAFSTHPETIFFAVAFAALLAYFSMVLQSYSSESSFAENFMRLSKAKLKAIGYLLVSAAVSIVTTLPLTLPFLEYMRNSHLYKESYGGISASSWGDFVAGFFAGQGLEPLFIGSIAAMLVLAGAVQKNYRSIALTLALVVAFLLAIPQGLVLQLFSHKPFSYVAPYYITPEIVLMLTLLAGSGFDAVIQARRNKVQNSALLIGALIVICLPLYYINAQLGAGATFSRIWLSGHNILTYTSMLAASGLLFCFLPLVLRRVTLSTTSKASAAALILLNFGSLALAGRTVLPVNPGFSLAPLQPVAFLRESRSRCAAVGRNFFLPNANLDFGVQDFRCFSPLLPTRYHNYLKACGAEAYNLYFYSLPERCSKLLDIASVKYVASRSAISAADETAQVILSDSFKGRLLPGLRILRSTVSFDAANSQLNAELVWRIHDQSKNRYSVLFRVSGADGKPSWSGRETILSEATSRDHTFVECRSFPIPGMSRSGATRANHAKSRSSASKPPDDPAASQQGATRLEMLILDTWTGAQIQAEDARFKCADGAIKICDLNYNSQPQEDITQSESGSRHYMLVREYADAGSRVYENLKACPPGYLVSNVRHFAEQKDAEQILSLMQSPEFSPLAEAIVEDGASLEHASAAKPAFHMDAKRAVIAAKIIRPNCNTVLADCDAADDSYLVLTDTYYPGWKCFVDGTESRIYPANYLFRAVKVPKGHHKVKFVFAPANYYYSWAASLSLLLGLLVAAVYKRKDVFTDREAV